MGAMCDGCTQRVCYAIGAPIDGVPYKMGAPSNDMPCKMGAPSDECDARWVRHAMTRPVKPDYFL